VKCNLLFLFLNTELRCKLDKEEKKTGEGGGGEGEEEWKESSSCNTLPHTKHCKTE